MKRARGVDCFLASVATLRLSHVTVTDDVTLFTSKTNDFLVIAPHE